MADSSSNSQFSRLPILTGSKDYALWSLAIKNQARLLNIWSIYNGTRLVPTAPAATASAEDKKEYKDDLKQWNQDSEKAIGLLGRTVSNDLSTVLDEYTVTPSGSTTAVAAGAKDQWDLLKSRFKKCDGISAVIDWGNLINTCLVDDGSNSMEQQLATFATHRSRVALNGFTHPDWQFAALILLALPPSFETIKSAFLDGLTDPKNLDLNVIVTHITEKDACNAAEKSALNAVAGPSKKPNKKGKGKAKQQKESNEKKPPGPCFHCGKDGHWNKDSLGVRGHLPSGYIVSLL